MSRYDSLSREELLRKVEELENATQSALNSESHQDVGWFRKKYAKKIFDAIPDMMVVLTRDGEIDDVVSSEEANHVGVPSKELPGRTLCDLLSPENADNVKNNLDHAFASGCRSMAHHDITLNGLTRHYENRIFPLDNQYALCMCRDVTAEQLAKRELETVKYAMNSVDEEIYACTTDGKMVYGNQLFRVHNSPNADIMGHYIYEFWLPAGNQYLWEERLNQIRSAKGTFKYTIRFKNEQGKIVAWDIVSYIMHDEFRDEDVVWFFGHEVTLRILHENQLKEMNSVMDSILNNIPVYLYVKDPGNEFRYLYWNKAFEEHSHILAQNALGHTDFEIFPNLIDAERFRKDDLALLHNGERKSYHEQYNTADGELRILTSSKTLVSMENRLPLIIGLSWDVTEQKAAEREIIEARVKAEESDKLKSAFLANMSHEIRTPLNAIVGFSKLLSEVESDEEKQQYADIIDTNSELLLQLINDILDISKIEAGTLEFQYKTVELNELCRGECEVFRTRKGENVELIFDDKHPKSVRIESDQNRLTQVIANLLTNACKFTREGAIHFGFDLHGNMIDFYVRDSGVGIAPEKVNNIFERFVKLNNFAVGTGLGLSISKMIVEKMGGTIGVESQLGKGSCFHFSLPIRRTVQPE
ncbi:MAG: PAS domain-containing protein [Alistipes sp.]